MIELKNVTKQYSDSVTAVDKLSFTVQEGEIFGLIGTSGCGKTTTLKMINRLEEPTSGSIGIAGNSILKQPPEQLRRGIGYVIQNMGLFPHYSVAENIAITPKLLDWNAERIEKRSQELLQMVGLNPEQYAHRKPEDLSGGQQQRVGLARALAADPPIILMDEPFGALDPITKEQIQHEFKELLNEISKTIVLVTHDVFEAFVLCDRIGLMNEGKLQQVGTPSELLFQPDNNFIRTFFDAQRFQLEMMSITMGDIIKTQGLLQNSPSKGEQFELDRISEDATLISLDTPILDILENSVSNREYYLVQNDDQKPVAKLTADELLQGFQHVRRNLKEIRDD